MAERCVLCFEANILGDKTFVLSFYCQQKIGKSKYMPQDFTQNDFLHFPFIIFQNDENFQ